MSDYSLWSWDEIQSRSEALFESYDRSIQRVIDIERQLARELETFRMEEGLGGTREDLTDSDTGDSIFDDVRYPPEVSVGPHIQIDPVPRFIESPDLFCHEELRPRALRFSEDGTVILDYTPSHYMVDEDEDSDTETVVDDWEEPWTSPLPNRL